MSRVSLQTILREKEINVEAASTTTLFNALWRSFRREHAAGIAVLTEMAQEVRARNDRVLRVEEAESVQGRELRVLLGADIARAVCEFKLGICFGLYESCIPVAAPDRERLRMSAREQIAFFLAGVSATDIVDAPANPQGTV